MNVRKVAWGLGGVLVMALGILIIPRLAAKPDDAALIRSALLVSIEASKEGEAGGVMDKISEKFVINDQVPGSRGQIARFIRESRPDVAVLRTDPLVLGEEARIVSPVEVSLSWMGQNVDRTLDPVTFIFRKEETRDWWVVPTRKWKLAEVEIPETSVADILQ
jgi:hypothetical protein